MKVKKVLAVILALAMLLALCACGAAEKKDDKAAEGDKAEAEQLELIVFAAASMQETLTELGDKYMEKNKDVKLSFNFDSSGTLKTQIEEGAEVDIFISAGQKQMNALDAESPAENNPNKLDFVQKGTRFNILENKVALAVPEGNPSGIKSYEDMAKRLAEEKILLAIGNADVPVGQYSQKILKFLKLDEEQLAKDGKITYGSNVKEVTTQVSEGQVACGIIYQTDAFSAKLKVVDTATKEMCGQVIYPAAIMKASKNTEAAQAFLDFLTSAEAAPVFENVGFTPLGK